MKTLLKKVRKPCTSPKCPRRVITYAYVTKPRCQPCRRRMKALGKARQVQQEKRFDERVRYMMDEIAELLGVGPDPREDRAWKLAQQHDIPVKEIRAHFRDNPHRDITITRCASCFRSIIADMVDNPQGRCSECREVQHAA